VGCDSFAFEAPAPGSGALPSAVEQARRGLTPRCRANGASEAGCWISRKATAVAAICGAASRLVAIRFRDLVMMAGHTREPGGSMDLKGLQRKAKQLIDRRGGTDSLKADAEELKDIAKGPGSVADKAKRAGEALKDPGAKGDAPPAPHTSASGSPASPAPATEPGRSPDA
jgi:hypothetical protein